ncbi:MAG TPA: hypothetical protein VGZ73_27365 [Bryobacteraceae bacterium]|jgi:hypothetical protein|nr:hypothetical protein [Bryobacteraceae bacterium]
MLPTKRFLIPFLLAAGAWNCAGQICTFNGATVNGLPVGALANFTVGDGFVTVSLQNTQADPKSAAQLLNGISFTLSSGQTSGSLGPNSANLRRVQMGGRFVDYGPTATGWGLESAAGGALQLCGLCSLLGFIAPTHLLIGDPAGSGTYASANASIAGNLLHNPYTSGPATFLISVPGIVAGATVTSATFSFGTQAGATAPGFCGLPIF